MPGTGPRQRAAIAISFGVQAVLIAGALALPAELSTTASVSVAAPVMLLPAVSPLTSGAPFQTGLSVTVKAGQQSGTWTEQSGPSVLLTDPGPDVTAWVTLTVPDSYPVRSLSFSLADVAPRSAQAPSTWGTRRALLNVTRPIGAGTCTFMLHLGSLGPQSGEDIVMTAVRSGAPGVASGVIAEIVTS
jgi:hypothetical protein